MSQNFTLDDLADAVKILAKRGQKMAPVVQWGYSQIQILTTWQTTAQGQLDSLAAQVSFAATLATQDAATIAQLQSDNAELTKWKTDMLAQWAQESLICDQLQAQIKDLTAQLAAATISPLSLVMIDTHLYGFSSVGASQAFYDANSGRPKQMFNVTDFQMDPPEGTT